ncbi:MAG TPA: hypothetical protein VII13_18965 [Vicinamibacteria bacterium]|jgi:hypothetical protein
MTRRTVLTRRAASRLILALPVAAPALAQDAPPGKKAAEKPTPQAECIAAQEAGLSDAERETLKKSITGFDKAVQAVRDFKVPADVPPAVRFAPLKPRRA